MNRIGWMAVLIGALSWNGVGCGGSDAPPRDLGPIDIATNSDAATSDGGATDGGSTTDGGPVGDGGTTGDGGTSLMPLCGNGIVDTNETCDDGDGILTDDCPDGPTGTCQTATCGDGYLYGPGFGGAEQCDDGNMDTGDGCDDSCQRESSLCGDGNLDTNEACDLGGANSDVASGSCPQVCRTDCSCPRCGDGVTDYALGEECDDYNTSSGDGCSSSCAIEVGSSCGDGSLDPSAGEECDDGGNAAGDGCSPTCQFETLGSTCGTGGMTGIERCDDGNTVNGDGCNPTCNLRGEITPFVAAGGATTLFADDTYLWIAEEGTNSLQRVDIDACIAALASASSCSVQTVLSGLAGQASSPVSDGHRLWFATATPGTAGPYIMELDIAACETAGLPCNSTPQIAAGTSAWRGHGDGVGTAAALDEVRGLTYYDGRVYFVEGTCGTLRVLDPDTQRVSTLVGPSNPTCPGSGAVEGFGAAARLGSPRYMTSDNSGNLFLTDNADDRIYRYDTRTGYLERWVGSGARGYVDNADGTMAQLSRPRDLTSDGTSIYWAAYNSYTVRQSVVTARDASTLVGTPQTCGDTAGTGTSALMGKPFSIAYHYPTGSLFVMSGLFNGGSGGTGECGTMSIPSVIWRVE